MSVIDLIKTSCELYKTRTAIEYIDKNKDVISISYEKFHEDIRNFSRVLSNLKKDKNTTVGIIGENNYFWVVTYIATLYSNYTIIPIDRTSSEESIIEIINKVQLDILCVGSNYSDRILRNQDIKILVKKIIKEDDIESYELDQNISLEIKNEPNIENEIGAILFTSGTTGGSKGVELTQKNLISNCEALTNILKFPKDKKIFNILPFHHAYSAMCDIWFSIYNGYTLSIGSSIKYIKKELQIYNPNYMFVVPMIAELISSEIKREHTNTSINIKDLSKSYFGENIEQIICGGAQITPSLVNNYRELGINLMRGYGITECSPIISVTSPDEIYDDYTVGNLLECNKVKIVDNEILVNGSNVMRGYLNNETATKEAFKDSWFKTGDLGRFEDGLLYITGRKNNMIVLPNGKNVYPEEIEKIIKNDGSIDECVVFLDKGENCKEGIAALIVLNDTYKSDNIKTYHIRVKDTIEQYNRKSPLYKNIRNYYIIEKDDLERTSTNKIKRGNEYKIKQKHTIANSIINLIQSKMVNKEEIDLSTSLASDLDYDSFEMYSLAIDLESLFNIEIKDADVEFFRNIKDIANYIFEKKCN